MYVFYTSAYAVNNTCRIEGYQFAIYCGELVIPSKPSLPKITLKYYKIPAKVRYPHPEPIIWIPDGIGAYTTERTPSMISLLTRARNYRDFIWLETRGTGQQGVGCRDDAQLNLTSQINRYQSIKWQEHCKAKLNAFNAIISVSDIAADYERLLQQLNIKQVVVYTEGKGVDVLNAWIKQSPQRFKAIVIDSPSHYYPESLAEKSEAFAKRFQTIIDNCKNNQHCNQRFNPDALSISNLIDKLPVNTRLVNPLTGKIETVQIDKVSFHLILSGILKHPSKSWMLPYLMDEAQRDNWQPFISIATSNTGKRPSKFEHANNIIEQCASFNPNHSVTLHSHHAKIIYQTELERLTTLCRSFQLNADQAFIQKNPDNQIPTLILKGDLNPLINHHLNEYRNQKVIVANGAMTNLMNFSCAKDVMYRFLKGVEQQKHIQDIDLEADCLSNIKAPVMPQYELLKLTTP